MFDAAYKKFDVGHKDEAIDKNGMTMAAIRALHKKVRKQKKILAEQERRIEKQERMIELLSKS
uniref:Transposase n=1 Tax=Candidatus Kentrum sp. LFY TaxID=2126342 RepID=A0A450W9U3_9GAMM|nr:MAG: hypothetical protein BECKLFY1418C_GA0070996_100455 [Candidatus Kentron sp. LFY]